MSYYEGLSFFTCLIVVLLIAMVIGILEKPLKWYSLLVSLLFVAFVFAGNPSGILYLLLFYGWSCLLILGYFRIRAKSGRKAGIYHAAVLLSLVPLVLCKVTPLFHLSIFGFVGISYLTFRVVQMIIEIYDGVIKEVLKINEGLNIGSVRSPLTPVTEEDRPVVEAAAQLIRETKERFL